MSPSVSIKVRFHAPPEDLRRYFTTFYTAEIDPGAQATLDDCLHPEWAGMRFFAPSAPVAWTDGGMRIDNSRFLVTGPTSRPIHFRMRKARMWGFGLLPLGWARFVGKPAGAYANVLCDGFANPDFAAFVALATAFTGEPREELVELQQLVDFFRGFKPLPLTDATRILAIHAALVDPQLVSVTELVERIGTGQRTVERLCHRHFGFSPKLLLRRQRLMRSLAQFMLDPSLKWIGAMDSTYHDQAQFVRDFHEFMGMAPSEYAAMPHPILETFIHERARIHGAAVQTLDRPDGTGAGA